jgi:sec-independent protein translocase protein TatA
MFRNPTTDILIVLFIVLIIFGPKRLPLLGRELGRGIREFKDSITTSSKDAEEGEHPEITQASASSPAAPAAAAPAAPAPAEQRPAEQRPAGAGSERSS